MQTLDKESAQSTNSHFVQSRLLGSEKEQAMREMMDARQKREKLQRMGKRIVTTISTFNLIPSAIMLLLLAAAGVVALVGLAFTLGDGLASFSDSILGGAQTVLYYGRSLVIGDTTAAASDYVFATATGTAISHFIISAIIIAMILPVPIILSIALYRGHGWARVVLMIFYFSAVYVLIWVAIDALHIGPIAIIMPAFFATFSLVSGILLFVNKSVKEYMEYAINN